MSGIDYQKVHWPNLKLTFFQLSSLIARGGVGAADLLFNVGSKPTGRQPEAVVLSSSFSTVSRAQLCLRNSSVLSMESSSDKQEIICFFANSKPFPWGFLKLVNTW